MKVSEITITMGATRSTGTPFEFNRVDITNKLVLEEPLELESRDYRDAHKEAAAGVAAMVERSLKMLSTD